MTRSGRTLPVVLASALALSGCGPQTFNVRASRAYANEYPKSSVVSDRTADLARAVELADELLLATPYTPGDRWPKSLSLDDDGADAMRDRIEDKPPYDEDHEIPLAKLYKLQLERALVQARKERGAHPGKFPGVLHAAATLAPGAEELGAQWAELVRAAKALGERKRARQDAAAAEQELGRAQKALADSGAALAGLGPKDGDVQVVAGDALEAVAFVLRMHVESLSVAPYVIKQTKRLRRSGEGDPNVIVRVQDISVLLVAERVALEALATALQVPARRALGDTGGFVMHENAIEQAARVNFDSTHIHLKGDSQLLLYNQLASQEAHPGRTRRLEYSIDPVFMVGGRVILAYDFLHVKNAASLNAGFTTDRLFSAGGDVENEGSLGTLIGLGGLASDFFDIGADLMGFHTSVVFAKFTSGSVTEIQVDPATNRDVGIVGVAPFQLSYHRIDVGFDFTVLAPDVAEELYVESFIGGFQYMDYSLPRILYELREREPGSGTYVLNRQTPPQSIESRFYMGGLALRLGQGDWPRISFFGDIAAHGGAGPGTYYFTPNPNVPGGPRDVHDITMLAFDASAALGARFRLTKSRRPRLVLETSYQGSLVGQGAITEIQETKTDDGGTKYTVGKTVDLGGFDLFHGPRLILVLVL